MTIKEARERRLFEVNIVIKHFGRHLFSSLQMVDSLAEAELIGLGMRTGAHLCLDNVIDPTMLYALEDLTATIE